MYLKLDSCGFDWMAAILICEGKPASFITFINMKLIVQISLFGIALMTNIPIALSQQPVKVEIRKTNEGYELLRAGKPYFVNGAGGTSKMERLKANGGNSIRTWSTSGGAALLDKAEKLGLTVTLGLDVARERHGFNYDDAEAVKKQLQNLREQVRKFKDHPALLAWGIGNELNLDYKNPKVWDAVNDIAKMIHEEDPNHLATTMLAGFGKRELDYIKAKCPALDFISVQVYGDLADVPARLKTFDYAGAYLVTEWGPTGHWECPTTPWGASIEEISSRKAAVYKSRYEASIKTDKNCLGSYVFLWGQKQERTPTWYGLFTEQGEESEVVDVMHYLWTGKWPVERAPHLTAFTLDGKKASDGIYLSPSKSYTANVVVTDANNDKLETRWEVLAEATELSQGGDHENRPRSIAGLVKGLSFDNATFTSPDRPGNYRLFVYVSDGKNKVATANIPFCVR
ncbi:MAG: hypothetical protein EOO90_12490 [Pedobacter sp.]|nr:MAG: hypothetical protein EOO90_12490 [Pedobacter sp.]